MFTSPDTSSQVELLINQTTKKRVTSVFNNDIQQLFIDITKKLDHNSIESLKSFIPIDEILFSICEIEPHQLVQYIKQIVFFLSRAKLEFEARSNENDYEKIIQKLEAQIRLHIRIEQQQRLYIESQQAQFEEFKNQYETLERNYQKIEISYAEQTQQLLELQKQLESRTIPQRKGNSDHQKLPDEKKGRVMSTNINRSHSGDRLTFIKKQPINLQMLFIKTQQHRPLLNKRTQLPSKNEILPKQKEFLQLSYRGSMSKLIY